MRLWRDFLVELALKAQVTWRDPEPAAKRG